MPGDALTLSIGGQKLTGWQEVSVRRGVEQVPSAFTLKVTERFPGAGQIDVQPFQRCTVAIGQDLVITGYVDRCSASLSARGHEVTVSGRSLVEDLVDCSAILPNMQVSATSLSQLAQDLAKPFGIQVFEPDGEPEPITGGDGSIPPFAIALGETPFEIIERVARWKRLLVHDDPQGRLVLAKLGTQAMASGVAQGVNVEAAQVTFAGDQRFSVYLPALFSSEALYNLGQGGAAGNRFPPVQDAGVPRYRPRFVVSEQTMDLQELATARAKWEMARRYGRSQAATVTVDSWRDSAGTLWTPNRLCPVDLPALKVTSQRWLIASATYQLGLDGGTRAQLVLMPPEAFQPEPNLVQPFDMQVYRDLHGGTPAVGPAHA